MKIWEGYTLTLDESPVLRPGEGLIPRARGSLMGSKAVAAQTNGDFSLMERTLPPAGRRPPPHRHTNCSEAFFVLDGTVTVELEGIAISAGPGDFARYLAFESGFNQPVESGLVP